MPYQIMRPIKRLIEKLFCNRVGEVIDITIVSAGLLVGKKLQ